jgi:bifunctional non-homologous end joining protein LigD
LEGPTASLLLEGKKLKGEWLMERDSSAKDKSTWALVKAGKSMRPVGAKRDDSSAVSGRSMAEIAESRDRVWHSNRVAGTTLDKLPETAATYIAPMQALLVAELPESEGWRYELKLDGYARSPFATRKARRFYPVQTIP